LAGTSTIASASYKIEDYPDDVDDEELRSASTDAAPVPEEPSKDETPALAATRVPEETQRLRVEGSRTIASQDKIEKAVAATTVATLLVNSFKELADAVGPFLWLGLATVGLYIFLHTHSTKFARAEDSLLGKNTSR
jgi:hypothetical protein